MNMTIEQANAIITDLKNKTTDENQAMWERFDYKQAEYASLSGITLFKSYSTIVGIVISDTLYELGKYSPTTSKQVTQFCNRFGYDRVLINEPSHAFNNYWKSVRYK